MRTRPSLVLALALLAGCEEPPCPLGTLRAEGSCVPRPLRLVAPLSTSTVTSARPTLRWAFTDDADGAHVEICRDRACTDLVAAFDADGTSAAPPIDLPAGVVFWRAFERRAGVTGAIPSYTWQMNVRNQASAVDTSWGTTFDFNGDGFADVAAASMYSGGVHVYFGGQSGIESRPTFSLHPIAGDDDAFAFVANAGDLNGDGFADLAVVAGTFTAARYTLVYIYLGGDSGYPSRPDVVLNPFDSLSFMTVASAGDVDADGYGDLIVGGPDRTAFLYRGGIDGLRPSPATLGAEYGSVVSLAALGDIDGDGFGDVAIGSAVGGVPDDRVEIHLGGPEGVSRTSALRFIGDGTMPFGKHLAVGDFDGDGRADLAIGTNAAMDEERRVYIHAGDGSGLSSTANTILDYPDAPYSCTSLAASDVNGDGFDDLVVGAPSALRYSGAVRLHLGGPSGLATRPVLEILSPFPPQYDGFGASFGAAIAGGDVNGDGFADIAIGAAVAGGTVGVDDGPGHVYLFFGETGGLPAQPSTLLVGPDGPAARFGSGFAVRARSAGARLAVRPHRALTRG